MDGAPSLYPFTALVGQERMKLALVACAVNPRLCGVLIRGQKGTAKSTGVRALAALLPEIDAVEGCAFGCDPDAPAGLCSECAARAARADRWPPGRVRRRPRFETLPLGVTEDRLVGTLDLEHALRRGEKRFEPGVLARVHRGVLYVDEVNLLEDHIVDVLLDAAAMGVCFVEREGVSHVHPSLFLLVGTMNPEEGELRPQLLDRFGLCVDVAGVEDVAERAEIVARRLDFERDPHAFRVRFAAEEAALGRAIAEARERLPRVQAATPMLEAAARLSVRIGVDGHRADILAVKAAATLAALDGRLEVETSDLARAAELVYPHRVKRQPFDDRRLTHEEIAEAVAEATGAPRAKKRGAPSTAARR